MRAEGVEAPGLEKDAREADVREEIRVGGFEEGEEAVAPGGDDAAAAPGAAEAEAGKGQVGGFADAGLCEAFGFAAEEDDLFPAVAAEAAARSRPRSKGT